MDLDRYYVEMNFQSLPQLVVPKNERTYGVRVRTGGAIADYTNNENIYDRIFIAQWEKVENSPTVGIDITLDDFIFRGSKIESKVTENKDKDGKVTSRTTTYYLVASYSARGSVSYEGPQPPPDPKTVAKNKEAEAKKAANPFLANVSNTTTSSASSANRINFSRDYNYTTNEYSTSQGASENFRNNKDAIYSDYLRKFVDEAIDITNNRLNNLYGFQSQKVNELLWILNSKSHPEYQTQQQAIEAIKVLFVNQKAENTIDKTRENIQPLVNYLVSLNDKYATNDKTDKKMRYSSYYNLAKIYLYLDQPELAKKYADLLIENDYDAKDGEKLNEQITAVSNEFKRTSLTSRHGN